MISARSTSILRSRGNAFDVARIRAIPLRSVAADLGFRLTASGTGRCRLPGHLDRNPSFAVRQSGNRFTCYACGVKGDVIDLVMAMMGIDFVKACNWLHDRHLGAAQRLPLRSGNAGRAPEIRLAAVRPVGPAAARSADREVFEWLLGRSPMNSAGDAYLRLRGFTGSTIRHFGIGQMGDRGRISQEALGRFGRERLVRCGLTGEGEDRLVFPTGYLLFPFIIGGEVAYLQARRADQGTKWRWLCPRDLLPPVYNQDVLSGDVPTISICEGVTDAISAHQMGLAALGLVGADGRLDAGTIARLRGRNVAVYGDRDEAGSRFSRNLVRVLAAKGITAIPKRLPSGAKDLNDQLRTIRNGPE